MPRITNHALIPVKKRVEDEKNDPISSLRSKIREREDCSLKNNQNLITLIYRDN